MDENTDEVRQLMDQLVQARTEQQIEMVDRKLAVLKKYQG